jgi:hypothetical protein
MIAGKNYGTVFGKVFQPRNFYFIKEKIRGKPEPETDERMYDILHGSCFISETWDLK